MRIKRKFHSDDGKNPRNRREKTKEKTFFFRLIVFQSQ